MIIYHIFATDLHECIFINQLLPIHAQRFSLHIGLITK